MWAAIGCVRCLMDISYRVDPRPQLPYYTRICQNGDLGKVYNDPHFFQLLEDHGVFGYVMGCTEYGVDRETSASEWRHCDTPYRVHVSSSDYSPRAWETLPQFI